MHISPYIQFNGNCEEAFNFYVKAIGASIEMMSRFEGSPAEAQTSPEWRKKIIHARLRIGNTQLLASDSPPGRYEAGAGYHVALLTDSVEDADRIFKALSQGGQVHVPIAETFFAPRFGMLADKYGIRWMILRNTET